MDPLPDEMEVIEEPGVIPDNAERITYAEVIEQPASGILRNRDPSGYRVTMPLRGVLCTPENKTYPTIRIHGHVGPASITAICITKEGQLVHPYKLMGLHCNDGVFNVYVNVTDDEREYQFKNLRVQSVKKTEMPAILAERQHKRIDPFQKGFAHADDVSKIEVDEARLAIQVVVMDNEGSPTSLPPVFTDIICRSNVHRSDFVRQIREERRAQKMRVREERKARARCEREERIARARNLDEVVEQAAIIPDGAKSRPYVEITEQPAPRDLRFRYECEGRSRQSLRGVMWREDHNTYPTIKIHGYIGRAIVIVSCISEEGQLVHPYALTGMNCNHGVFADSVDISDDTREYRLDDLQIQCIKKKDMQATLANRQLRQVDPFQKGFAHADDISKIDQHALRLAVQVVVKDAEGRDYSLEPVVTDVIHDYAAPTPSEEQARREREQGFVQPIREH